MFFQMWYIQTSWQSYTFLLASSSYLIRTYSIKLQQSMRTSLTILVSLILTFYHSSSHCAITYNFILFELSIQILSDIISKILTFLLVSITHDNLFYFLSMHRFFNILCFSLFNKSNYYPFDTFNDGIYFTSY